jgi:hypothetical protein
MEDSPVLDIKPYPEWVSGRLIVVIIFFGLKAVLLPVLLQRPWLYHAEPSLQSPVLESLPSSEAKVSALEQSEGACPRAKRRCLPSSKAKGSEGIRPVTVELACEQDPSAMPQDDKKKHCRMTKQKDTTG